jgi:hypothetical protein
MLRNSAIQLLNELTTVYPELIQTATHISLQVSEGDTRLMLKSNLDFEQKTALKGILSGKGLKIVDCPSNNYETILMIY